MMTSLTRIVVMLSLLRTALGTTRAAQCGDRVAGTLPHRQQPRYVQQALDVLLPF